MLYWEKGEGIDLVRLKQLCIADLIIIHDQATP